MKDTFNGKVYRIIDGNTFEMKLSSVSENNKSTYSYSETIRIVGLEVPENGTSEGRSATTILETELLGKKVRCYIQSRDKYGRVVAKVEVVD